MYRNIAAWIAVASGLVPGAVALGAEPVPEAARRCAQILGERERLACFDRAFPAGPESAALAESRAAPAAAPAAVVAPAVAVAPAPAASAPRAPAPSVPAAPAASAAAATAVAATTVAAAPALGDEQVKKKDKAAREAEEAAQQTRLTAKVTGVKEVRQDTWRVQLDNGQAWLQLDMSDRFNPRVGDTIEVQRKRMGGYSMSIAGSNRSPWVRVSRVE
jgi:hypothetical protein